MKSKKLGNKHFIRLDRGENIMGSLKKYCSENSVNVGQIVGIGALDFVELAHYSVEDKEFSSRKYNGPLEITSLLGNVTTMDGEVYLHCHITLGNNKMEALTGHLVEGRIAATCEIILTEVKGNVGREHSDEIGLNLWEF